MRVIIIEISDHISDDEAKEFAQEINEQLQPHKDAYFAKIEGVVSK